MNTENLINNRYSARADKTAKTETFRYGQAERMLRSAEKTS